MRRYLSFTNGFVDNTKCEMIKVVEPRIVRVKVGLSPSDSVGCRFAVGFGSVGAGFRASALTTRTPPWLPFRSTASLGS